ncbi:MAG: ABC-2 type transport system ATP-binding protein [Flavobacteriales bacterium]|jgi:ABC-2 type transport system ATP-binding protein
MLLKAKSVTKRYGNSTALNSVDLTIEAGEIIGFFGPNGAGKTTFLRSILGLSQVEGDISLLGLDPQKNAPKLMEDVSFIADTAILPSWMKVKDCIDYVEGVHPNFNRTTADAYLAKTKIKPKSKISHLSKGMTTQLHLAIVMAIDSKFLVLDEPTLGLDIVFRKQFYRDLLDNYFDNDRTVLITTHQIEEIEDIVTRVVFINDGEIILNESMNTLADRYFEVLVSADKIAYLEDFEIMHKHSGLEGTRIWLRHDKKESVNELGDCVTPKLSDLFLAAVMENNGGTV